MSCNDPTQSFIEVERERAEIVVDFEKDGLVSFFTNNPYAGKYGVDRMRHTVPPRLEPVAHVLRGIARWNYFFRRRNNATAFLPLVNIEFYRIEADKRTGKTNFVGRNLNRSGRIDIPADPKEAYSMHIFNDTDYELYPYLLYFDVREQSIEPYFFPPMDEETNTEEPLPAHTSCTIGCTADGLPPFIFALTEGEHADIGFFKLYLTKSPIDISQIVQESPFQFLKTAISPRALNNPRPRLDLDYIETNSEDWGTISIAVVQRIRESGDASHKTNHHNMLKPSWQINLPAQPQFQGQPYQMHSPFPSRQLSLSKATSLPTIFSSPDEQAMEQQKPIVTNVTHRSRSREREREHERRRATSPVSALTNGQRKDSTAPTNSVQSAARHKKEQAHSPLKNSTTRSEQESLGSANSSPRGGAASSAQPPPTIHPNHLSASSPSLNEYVQSPQLGNNMNANLSSITNNSSDPHPYPSFNANTNANDSVQSLNGPQGSINSSAKPGKNPATKILNAFKLFKKKQ